MGDLAADPRVDEAYRTIAHAMGMEAIEAVAAEPQGLINTIAQFGRARTTMIFSSGELEDLGLVDPIVYDLFFAPVQPGHVLAAYTEAGSELPGVSGSDDTIILFVLPAAAGYWARVDPTDLWAQIFDVLTRLPGILTHEIIHMLDNMRGGRFMGRRREGSLPPPSGAPQTEEERRAAIAKYLSDPMEYNAMFQQGLYEMQTTIIPMLPDYKKRQIRDHYAAFEQLVNQTMGLQILRAEIQPKWERKLDARLWQTWQYWRDKGMFD